MIYIGAQEGVFALSGSTGAIAWFQSSEDSVLSQCAIGLDGELLASFGGGGTSGGIFAIVTDTSLSPTPTPSVSSTPSSTPRPNPSKLSSPYVIAPLFFLLGMVTVIFILGLRSCVRSIFFPVCSFFYFQ